MYIEEKQKEQESDRVREMVHPLAHSPNDHDLQNSAGLKFRRQELPLCLPHRYRDPRLEASYFAFPVHKQGMGSEAGWCYKV